MAARSRQRCGRWPASAFAPALRDRSAPGRCGVAGGRRGSGRSRTRAAHGARAGGRRGVGDSRRIAPAQRSRTGAQVLQVCAAAVAAVRRAEAGHRDAAARAAVQAALAACGAQHADDAHARRGEQMVDVPAQRLVRAQVTRDPRLQVAAGRARVHVAAGREVELAEPPDQPVQRPRDDDAQLVAGWAAARGAPPIAGGARRVATRLSGVRALRSCCWHGG